MSTVTPPERSGATISGMPAVADWPCRFSEEDVAWGRPDAEADLGFIRLTLPSPRKTPFSAAFQQEDVRDCRRR
jgi:hypothetical protein